VYVVPVESVMVAPSLALAYAVLMSVDPTPAGQVHANPEPVQAASAQCTKQPIIKNSPKMILRIVKHMLIDRPRNGFGNVVTHHQHKRPSDAPTTSTTATAMPRHKGRRPAPVQRATE
jgi:hypothetical protein